jgi:predicted NAD/FAD-binding protein
MPNRVSMRRRIAVIGTGIAGMSAAWLLNQRHDIDITVYERAHRLGGHSNTVNTPGEDGLIPVDTGFIVYNERAYPNLVALFEHLGVPTQPSDMSLAVSLDDGDLEYCGDGLGGLFAQKRNLVRPRFWSMLWDVRRFYRDAVKDLPELDASDITLGRYLETRGYGRSFCDDHLLPMAAAIWSAPARTMLDYPAAAFIRFHDNHGLLQVQDRPTWRTVTGGSRAYIDRLTSGYAHRIRLNAGVQAVRRVEGGVVIRDQHGQVEWYDSVVIAAHADQALSMLDDASPEERALLGAFRFTKNLAVLHSDASLMPKRRAVWSSWNYAGHRARPTSNAAVTYWMNRLQNLPHNIPLFVSLNPPRPPHAGLLRHSEIYEHPVFDSRSLWAQRQLWSLQGVCNTWYCGAYFGSGFHEDGLQAGLAVAEALGDVRRPWTVANESGRIPTPILTGMKRELT